MLFTSEFFTPSLFFLVAPFFAALFFVAPFLVVLLFVLLRLVVTFFAPVLRFDAAFFVAVAMALFTERKQGLCPERRVQQKKEITQIT